MPTIKSMTCPNCGAPLTDLKNATGVCDSCHTPYVIEEMQNCQNIISKEGIKSGIGFEFSPERAEETLLDLLTDGSQPDDILEKMEIEEVNYYYVPAYYYYYNASSPFMVDIKQTAHSSGAAVGVSSGGHISVHNTGATTTTTVVTSGNAVADIQGITSGRSDYDDTVKKFYHDKYNYLTDAESLELNPDIQTLSFDLPESSIIDSSVHPDANDALIASVKAQLQGRRASNLSLGAISLNKDKVDKILVGVCDITYQYDGQHFHVYSNNTGSHLSGTVPTDPLKTEKVDQLNKFYTPSYLRWKAIWGTTFDKFCRNFRCAYIVLAVIFAILALVCIGLGIYEHLNYGFYYDREEKTYLMLALLSMLFLIACIIGARYNSKKLKEYNLQKAAVESDRANLLKSKDDFQNSGRHLKGFEKFFKS